MPRYSPSEQRAYDSGYQAGLKAAKTKEPLTLDQIKAMSQEEVAKRLPEVNEVLASSGGAS